MNIIYVSSDNLYYKQIFHGLIKPIFFLVRQTISEKGYISKCSFLFSRFIYLYMVHPLPLPYYVILCL